MMYRIKTLYPLSSLTEGSCQLSGVHVTVCKISFCKGLPRLCNLDEMLGGTTSYCSVKLRVTDALVVVSKVGKVLSFVMNSTLTPRCWRADCQNWTLIRAIMRSPLGEDTRLMKRGAQPLA